MNETPGRSERSGRFPMNAMTISRGIGLLGAAGAIYLGQSWMLSEDRTESRAFAVYLLGVVLLIAVCWQGLARYLGALPATSEPADRRRQEPTAPTWLVGMGIFCTLVAFGRAFYRTKEQSANDIVVFWIAGMLLFAVAAFWGSWPRSLMPLQHRLQRVQERGVWLPVTTASIVLIAASVARLWELGRYSTVFDSDEGFFMLTARKARVGDMPNPFHLSFFSVPDFYLAWEGWLTRPFPDELASYRILSAIFGILTVYATWRIGRRLLGDGIGLMAAALLASMPLHVWASRDAMNNVFDATTLAFPVLFLDRAIARRSRIEALICGIILGFGLYGYYGSRIFLPVIAVCLAVAIVLPGSRLTILEAARLGWWILLGFASGAAPIIAHYAAFPDDFLARIRTVSVDSGAASPTITDRLVDIGRAIIYPMLDGDRSGGFTAGFYRGLSPMLGWTIAPLIAIGGATWVFWLVREWIHPNPAKPRPAFLLVVWLIVCTGVAQTENMQSQRFLAVTWVWALAGATGLAVIGIAIRQLVRIPTSWMRIGAGIAVVAIAIWNAQFYFNEDRQIVAYGDYRTTAAYDIGWRMQSLDSPPTILLAGTSMFSYSGFGNWIFMVPGLAPNITVLEPNNGLPNPVPVLQPNQLLILPGELPSTIFCPIQEVNPTAHRGESRSRDGHLLYTIYSSGSDLILPTAETPGETTLVELDPVPCQETPT